MGEKVRKGGCGVPTIGNNVVICAGAIVIGNITVGDNAIIAAGCVVNKDVPSGTVVGGVPAHVLSNRGEEISKYFIKGIGE